MDRKYLEKQASILVSLYNSKKFEEAVQKGKMLIKKFPRQLMFYNATALSLSSLGNIPEALRILKEGLNVRPNDIFILNNLGLVNSNINNNKISREYLEKALSINENFMDALLNLGNLNLKEGKTEHAKNNFIKALKLSKSASSDETINMALGNLNQQTGEFSQAIENYKIVNKINPQNTSADKAASTIYKYKNSEDPHYISMKNKIGSIKDHEDLKSLYFALGKACEDFGNFEESLRYLKLGNLIADQKIQYNVEEDKKLFAEIKRIFENTSIDNIDPREEKIIFILGMPRSGTTLAEQIISSHKEVQGAGELNYISEAIENVFKNNINKDLPLWKIFKNINEISPNNLLKMQSEYSDKLKLHNFTKRIITDKAPLNFRWIGFIKKIFPNSKIIHCKRSPMDICFSNYKNSFSAGSLGFCYNLSKLGTFYNLYNDLMQFWDTKYKNQIYQLSYENLINNKEKEIKELLKFCDLDWDENCLNPHQNKKPVATASLAQVRSPMYKSSIEKWRNFEFGLEELKNIIN
tara:strand:+ start:470 stop:2044 length:1575 start_codon:yes stop_codon:yes gene_type:complete